MKCIFCNEDVFKNGLCIKHYKMMIETKNDYYLHGDISRYNLKNHYHNLRYSIFRQRNLNHIIDCLIKLIAISELYQTIYKDSELVGKVYDFSKKIILQKITNDENNKKEKDNYLEIENYDYDYRKFWPCKYRCDDGHMVRSQSELLIDNWLFHNNIIHVYEKEIILSNGKSKIISDFYLPSCNLYIEYWGLYTKKYISRRIAKKELYIENNIALLEINFTDMEDLNGILEKAIKNHLTQ